MSTIDFEISDDDLNLVTQLLEEVLGEQSERPVWQALDAERARRIEGAGPMPIRLNRDLALGFSEWLARRARAHAQSTDSGDSERATALVRVGIAVEAALKNPSVVASLPMHL